MNDESLKSDVNDALLTCMADVPEEEVAQWEARGMKKIRELADRYGADEVINCVTETDHDYSFELYFLARAGVQETQPHLEKLLSSEDEDTLSSAVSGLLYLDAESGWKALRSLIKDPSTLSEPVEWYFEEDLKKIGTDRALQMLDLMK